MNQTARKTESDTPRTDAVENIAMGRIGRYRDLARTLERELAAVRSDRELAMRRYAEVSAEKATLRAALEAARRANGQGYGVMPYSERHSALAARIEAITSAALAGGAS